MQELVRELLLAPVHDDLWAEYTDRRQSHPGLCRAVRAAETAQDEANGATHESKEAGGRLSNRSVRGHLVAGGARAAWKARGRSVRTTECYARHYCRR